MFPGRDPRVLAFWRIFSSGRTYEEDGYIFAIDLESAYLFLYSGFRVTGGYRG
jgi:hypothetical protein